MAISMTGFAARTGGTEGYSWSLELRAVNAKGLDIRLRLPEPLLKSEPAIRAKLQKSAARGNLNLAIRLDRGEAGASLKLDTAALVSVIDASLLAAREAEARGLALGQATAADFLAIPGVMRRDDTEEGAVPVDAILRDLDNCIAEFQAARAAEGAALDTVLRRQLDEIEALTTQATKAAEARRPKAAQTLTEALRRVTEAVDEVDPDRVAQELALLAVKADVTEEIDRLTTHIAAGRALLDDDGPIGRRLDFLMQEFNREANTLCSKSGDADLTKCGLELKALIEQMREQVQNVE